MTDLSRFSRIPHLLMLGARGELGNVTEDGKFQIDPELTRRFATYAVRFLHEYAANRDDHRFRVALIYLSHEPKPWGHETLRLTDTVVHTLYPVSGAKSNELTVFQKKKRDNSVYYGMELLLEYTLKDAPGVPIFVPVLFDRNTTLGDYAGSMHDALAGENPAAPVIELLNFIGPVSASHGNVEAFQALRERISRGFVKKDARRPLDMQIMDHMRSVGAPSAAATPGGAMPNATLSPSGGDPAKWYDPALHEPICDKMQTFLLRPAEHPDLEQVRHFQRFAAFNTTQQNELASLCPMYLAPTGTVLLEPGSSDQWNLYLVQGNLRLVAPDGEERVVSGGAENSRNAIAALKPRKFRVTAETPARFLWIHEKIVAAIQQHKPAAGLELLSS
jgi:hypothetical protein